MKTKKYLIISALALLAYSCQTEEIVDVQPTPGQEVQFGASLEKNATRTIYGDENDKGFPIYWVEGDEVVVFSPECADGGGVGSATYKVHVDNEAQNYASSLDKTGDIGVRWGDNPTGSFYSIYPASSLYTKIGNGYKTATLTMPAQQDNNIVTENGKKIVRSDMRSCFMYAETSGVKSGETVDLKYKPLSTALRFTLTGPQTGDPVTITYVRIYAPSGTYISGTCNVDFSTTTDNNLPTMTIVNGTGRNYVTMNAADASTGAYLTLAQGETIEMNAFLLITQNTVMTDKWYIEVGTASGKSYKKYLDTSASDKARTLVPGMVHRLTEALPSITSDEWSAANWMANLQRNVYLSEISIPGAWYSMHSEYQPENNTITSLYQKGVRAFHLDTRWIGNRTVLGWLDDVVDLGVVDTDDHTFYEQGSVLKGDKYLTTYAPTFENTLKEIVAAVQPEEYMVVICTFAQGSGNYVYGTNADGSDKVWIHKISEICNSEDFKNKVIEASQLNANSTVADVLGKVIVIVNTYTETPVSGSKCFFMNIPISQNSTVFQGDNYYKVPLKYNNVDAPSSGITVYGTHAQQTAYDADGSTTDNDNGYVPTISERKDMAEKILDWSKANYSTKSNDVHNIWMYLGLGGYVYERGGDDYTTIRDELSNNFLGAKVQEMYDSNSYYPIGIILLNDIAASHTTGGMGLAQSILEMNNKYRKAYDPNRSPVDGSYINGTGNSTVQSAAPGYSSGMKDNNTNAIGWTRCR
ncbi:hypothetical protein [Prevotella sp.]|uniref:hypothetical protein n=1 Tax=Prevotella sp. TaxID=59823 RepID=UPI003AB62913